jgi:NADH dehydrogenase [ubiquinone] 1 alpha subcomplex assembly factor 7
LRSELHKLRRQLANPEAEWEMLSPFLRDAFDNDPKQWTKELREETKQLQAEILEFVKMKTAQEQKELALQQERLQMVVSTSSEVRHPISSIESNTLLTLTLVRSASLDALWHYLSTAEDEDSFLSLPIRHAILPKRMTSLYIRRSYRDLYDRMLYFFEEDGNSGFPLTGTPGIGKSVFLFYVLWRLARLVKPPEVILLHRAKDFGYIYLITPNGCFETRDINNVAHFLKNDTTWYLTETLDPPPTLTGATTILVSSPNRKHYSEFLKVHESVPLHYLEPWSLDELLIAASIYDLSADVVRERYRILGGVSRYVFSSAAHAISDIEELISQAFQMFDFDQLSLVPSNMFNASKISHRLVHLFINRESELGYTKVYAKFGSRFILEKALSNYIQSSKAKLVDFLVVNKASPATKLLQGNLFEQFAHQQLSKGGRFEYRSLESGDCQTYHLELSPRNVISFYNIEVCADKGSYYIPLDANFPCVDAFAPSVGFFQMTINVHHPIAKVKMAELVIATDQTKLFFVVPDYLYKSYQRQIFENESDKNDEDQGGKGISKKHKGRIEEVKQFALCIPLDFH